MFKKKLVFRVEDMEAVDFCKILGKYGFRFKIGKRCEITLGDDENRKLHYRVFTVYASRRKAYALYKDLNRYREPEI